MENTLLRIVYTPCKANFLHGVNHCHGEFSNVASDAILTHIYMYIDRKVSSEEGKDKLRDKSYVLISEFIYIQDEYNHSFRIRKEQRKRKIYIYLYIYRVTK